MKEMFFRIFSSGIMYYVVVPIMLLLLGWIKSNNDLKEKNKELGYWMLKCRRLPTFPDFALRNYIMILVNLIVMLLVRRVISLKIGKTFSYIICGSLYFALNVLIILKNSRSIDVKMEFWKNGKEKKVLTIILYIIYAIPFFLELYGRYTAIIEIVFIILLLVWALWIFNYYDVIFILDNKYANIYVKGSEQAQVAEAGTIKKRGEWIYVNRYVNGYKEELRIKESEIVRIDYYGEPLIMVKKPKLLNLKKIWARNKRAIIGRIAIICKMLLGIVSNGINKGIYGRE